MRGGQFVLVFTGGISNVYDSQINGVFVFPWDLTSSFRVASTTSSICSDRVVSVAIFLIVRRLQVVFPWEFSFGEFTMTSFSENAQIVIYRFSIFGGCAKRAINDDDRGM